MSEPLVSLTRTQSIAALMEQASKDFPTLHEDGMTVSVRMIGGDLTLAGSVRVKDIEGRIAYTRTWVGDKQLDATITWRF
jgi:hypothetical protein